MMRAIRCALMPFLCVIVVLACKGQSKITPVPLGVTPAFQPDTPTVTSEFVSLQKSAVNGEHITLDVVVTDVNEPISGIAIKLMFPGDIALFESCSDGDLLPAGTCYVSQTPLHTDEVFIGRTIINPQQPVPAVGSRTIVSLHFLVFGVGGSTDNIAFEAPNLGGGDATALLDAAGNPIFVNWYTGTLSGR